MAKLNIDDIERIAKEVEEQEIRACKCALKKTGIELPIPYLDEDEMDLFLNEADYY